MLRDMACKTYIRKLGMIRTKPGLTPVVVKPKTLDQIEPHYTETLFVFLRLMTKVKDKDLGVVLHSIISFVFRIKNLFAKIMKMITRHWLFSEEDGK